MTDPKSLGQGMAFPPRIELGRWVMSSGARNIRESMQLILLTDLEERVMLPQFGGGLRQYLFRPNTVATRQLIQERTLRALTRWEPRIELTGVLVEEDPEDPHRAVMTIEYRLRKTGESDRVSINLQFGT